MNQIFDEIDNELIKNGFKIKNNFDFNIEVGELSVNDKKKARELNKDLGEYIIINSPLVHSLGEPCEELTQKILADNLKKLLKKLNFNKNKLVMIVGLGNDRVIPDALGQKVVGRLLITRNLQNQNLSKKLGKVCSLCPSVYSQTGIQTADIISAVTEKIKPDLVVVIDSLGTVNPRRLANSFQLSTSNIVPGGAFSDENSEISEKTLNTKCLILGVPLMQIFPNCEFPLTKVMTPKDISEFVYRCSKIIADSLNLVFHGDLDLVRKILN